MDADLSRWILEFLIRQEVPNELIDAFLKADPLLNTDSRLKKTILLKEIESAIVEASVPETVLETLEIIEELDRSKGIAVTDKMKAAYCAMAVECTVKYIRGVTDLYKYANAVNRIWIGKILQMEQSGKSELVSAELKDWMGDIEAAVGNASLCKNLVKNKTTKEALRLVKAYLDESWALLGSSFLELAGGRIYLHELQALGGNTDGSGSKQISNKVGEKLANNGQEKRGNDLMKSGDKLVDDTVGETVARFHNTQKVVVNDRMTTRYKDIEKVNMPQKCMQNPSDRRSKRNVKITDTEDLGVDKSCGKYDFMLLSEADNVKEALKYSSLELQSVVKDPLPEALILAKTIVSDMEKSASHETSVDLSSHQNNVPRLSLEQICATLVYKTKNSAENSRSSPEKHETAKITRRIWKRWSTLEEETLITGVERFGKGNWKFILNCYGDRFQGRTEVDLKDKWRNMTK